MFEVIEGIIYCERLIICSQTKAYFSTEDKTESPAEDLLLIHYHQNHFT